MTYQEPLHPAAQDSRHRASAVRTNTVWTLFANFALALLKFVAGVLANSQALVADAVHSLSDMVTDVAVLVGVHYWSAPADEEHPHGHGRIEMIVSALIGVSLAVVGAGIAWRGIEAMHHEPGPLPQWPAFLAACLSIVSKELMYRWTARVGSRIKSPALIANAWHHRSDAFSSIPVAVAVVGSHVVPAWRFLDPMAAVIVAVFILKASWSIAHLAIAQLLDTGADRAQRQRLREIALSTSGVRSVHALRTRHIGPGLQVDIHVMVDPDLTVREGHGISGAVKERLFQEGGDIVDVLIHIEPHENGVAKK